MKYEPYEYQTYATRFIEEKPESAIFLDCGLGKTSITLTAINHLMFDSFDVRRVLVIAPIRVAKFSWQEMGSPERPQIRSSGGDTEAEDGGSGVRCGYRDHQQGERAVAR